jgi:glycosyltransferase involved in cell wall biosynthesis
VTAAPSPVATVSCVIPTRDRPRGLRDAVASVFAQVRPPEEVVVVDDASAVPVREEDLRRLAQRMAYPGRLVVVRGRGQGAAAARNAGARTARGELLAFLDDDDQWEPEYLGAMVEAVGESGTPVAVAWTTMIGRNGRSWSGPSVAPGLGYEDCVATNPGVRGSNLVVHRTTFVRLGGYDEALWVSNDKDLFARLVQAGDGYAVVPQRLVRYRQHGGERLTTRHDVRRRDSLHHYLAKHGPAVPARVQRRLRLSLAREELALADGFARLRLALSIVELGLLVGPWQVLRTIRARARRVWLGV